MERMSFTWIVWLFFFHHFSQENTKEVKSELFISIPSFLFFSIQRDFWLLYTPKSRQCDYNGYMHACKRQERRKQIGFSCSNSTNSSLSLSTLEPSLFFCGVCEGDLDQVVCGGGGYPWGGLRWIYGETEGKRPRKRAAGTQYYRDVACWWSSTFHMQIQEAIKLLSSRVLLYLSISPSTPEKKKPNQGGTKSIGVDGEWVLSSSFSSSLSALEIAFWT